MKQSESNPAHYLISSAVLVLCRTLVTIGGFAVVVVLAAKFGITAQADAYFTARLLPITLVSPLSIAFNLAFVPVYMRILADVGSNEAAGLAIRFLNGTLIVSTALTVLYILLADPIVSLIAPGFSPENHAASVWMTRIMAPSIVLSSLHAVFDSVLNARRYFIASALSSLCVPAGALLGVTLMADQWGMTGLAAGAVAGFIAQAAVLVPIVRRHFVGYCRSPSRKTPSTSQVSSFLALSAFVLSGWQINTVIDRMFGSLLGEGAVSALGLGTTIIGLIPIVVAAPVYKVLYPELVRLVQERRHADIRRLLRDNFVVVTFITLPVAATLLMFAPLITQLAFGYGNFEDATARTSRVIFYGALGLPASISGMLLIYYFLATRNTGIIISTFVFSVTVNVLFNWILMNLMGIGGIALATTLMSWFRTGAMSFLAGRSLGGSVGVGIMTALLKSTAAALAAMGTMYVLSSALTVSPQEGSRPALFFSIAATVGTGAGVYLLASMILRNEALLWLKRTARKRKPLES